MSSEPYFHFSCESLGFDCRLICLSKSIIMLAFVPCIVNTKPPLFVDFSFWVRRFLPSEQKIGSASQTWLMNRHPGHPNRPTLKSPP